MTTKARQQDPLVIGNIRATKPASVVIGNIPMPGVPEVVTDTTPAEQAAQAAIREPSPAEWDEVAVSVHDAHEQIQ